MRLAFSIIFVILIIALGICMILAVNSRKNSAQSVALMTGALMIPIIGNLIIVNSDFKSLAMIGCYTYFLGMDLVMYSLFRFTMDYCNLKKLKKILQWPVLILLAGDYVQYALNPFFGHAFDTEAILVDGFDYYRLIPYFGQTFHRVLDYGLLIGVVVILIVKIIRSPRIYSERYSIILISLIVGVVWQAFFIFSRTPIDKSMIGFGIFGILIFYFALYYRPLRVLDRLLANIASDMPQALFFFDAFGKCIWANDHGIKLVNIEEERFDTASASLEEMFGNLDRDMDEWAEQYVLGEEDHEKYYAVEKHTVKDEKNRITGSFLSVRDNTEEQKRFLQEIYNATHDQLTGLYTKEHLYAKIKDKILSDRDTVFYIIFVDVKNFKIVNDIFGNRFGDYAIKCIAEWIRNTVSEGSVYGRIAGDTFGMCIPKEEFNAMKAKADLSNFIVKEGQKVHHVLIHLGIYEITKEDVDVSVMFDRAHLAISSIKDDYHDHLIYYDNKMREKALWDQSISVQLPDAIKEKQLRPYLQPIVDKNGNVVGAEALIRWIHPENGFMSPGVFIPVFEKNGLIVEADKYMWRSACEILSRWEKEGRDMFISVNISPKDFYFTNVTETLKKYVREYGIEPKNLRIEITESVMMSDIDIRMENLRELKNEGFIVEMDDFGSGFSSLNLLKDMPVDVLKIDMMFLSKSNDNQKALTIMQNIINLSDNLSISSLTEGVETSDQFETLNGLGCKLFQGYYFAKPMPVEEFEEKYPIKNK